MRKEKNKKDEKKEKWLLARVKINKVSDEHNHWATSTTLKHIKYHIKR